MKARNISRFVAVVLALGLFSCDSGTLGAGPSEPGGGDEPAGGEHLFNLTVVDSQGNPVAGLSAFVCYGSCSDAGLDTQTLVGERVTITPVKLDYFYSEVIGQEVSLYWGTISELNNAGFEVELEVGDDWTVLGFVEGSGTTSEPQTYSFLVGTLVVGTHTFRLKQIDFDGTFEYSEEVSVIVNLPVPIQISGGYPNPFYSESQFSYAVDHDQDVVVSVYDLNGALVETLHTGPTIGNEEQYLSWHARENTNTASGIYRVRISGESNSDSITVAYTDESSGGNLPLLMYLGVTDLTGIFATDDETRFPSLLNLEPILRTDIQGNVIGFVPLSNDVTIILRDDSGAVRRYSELLTAQSNLFELVWE